MKKRSVWFILAMTFAQAREARAGMTVYDLNDIVRLRLEEVSFFAALLLVCGLGIRLLWNYVARDFPNWPRLTYPKALCLTALLSLLMLLVLSMISGARELLTPGAWRRQGSEYRLNDAASEPMRRQSLEALRAALNTYAQSDGGLFPSHDVVSEIPEKIWQAPDTVGTHYVYIGGLTTRATTNLLACEPVNFGDQRFALFVSGEITKLASSEISRTLGIQERR